MMSLASSGRIGRQYFYRTVKILTAESNGQKLQVQGYASDNGKSDTAEPNGFQAASNGTGFDLSSSKSFDQAYSEHGNISQPINLSCSAPSLEGHQANEHEFSPSHQQDILNNSNRVTLNTEINDMTPGVAGGDQSGQQQNSDNHVPLYDSKTYVSLYGVMQSNVPEPYQPPETSNQAETHGHGESHLQMPSGGVVMGDKFMSSHRMDTHATTHITNPKRKFSSSVAHRSAITTHDTLEMQVDSPQGIQGEDDVRFKIWMENCSRFGFANCFDHLQGVQSGSKTLHEIFAEQDELIREAAERYRASTSTQDQKLDNPLTKAMLSGEHPYPQGIQGDPDECINLKLWMENCIRYGFTNCDDMLQGVQTGRKTLSQVFEEQEQEIRKVAEHYRNISSGSGSSGSDPKQRD
ncbi:unnamed protein product [Owenia fusiformis]|uniref:Uncharacterized protein n=1 Tax=Owenia fusiformis TaxID=6347 RepID=A0A8J1TU72_OWEFU|nr:unnamed protein product [Owenia fusiformis]